MSYECQPAIRKLLVRAMFCWNICSGWLRLALHETISILDCSRLVSDQSGGLLFPDSSGESILLVNHISEHSIIVTLPYVHVCYTSQWQGHWKREQSGRGCFFGLFIEKIPSLYTAQILPTGALMTWICVHFLSPTCSLTKGIFITVRQS